MVFNAFESKRLKVFPHYYIRAALASTWNKQTNAPQLEDPSISNPPLLTEEAFPYDMVIWVDGKYSLDMDSVLRHLLHFYDDNVAMYLPRRPLCCGSDVALMEALQQSRYQPFFTEMGEYILRHQQLGKSHLSLSFSF